MGTETEYKNAFNRSHYDRINLMVPAGKKEEIKKAAVRAGMSVNELIWNAVSKELHNSEYLGTIGISNRRYVGSKRKLLTFIRSALKNIRFNSFADLFAGTGVVADMYNKRKTIIVNDLLYSNYICYAAWFSDEAYDEAKLRNLIIQYNSMTSADENYVTETYGNRYFSFENASRIGFIRDDIERLKVDGTVNDREYALLLMSLLYAIQQSDVSRTLGHYMTYLKHPEPDGKLELRLPLAPSQKTNTGNQVFNMDALELIRTPSFSADVLYLDPPYSRQYGEYYHVLENIARWQKPDVFGETRRIRTPKSRFSITTSALEALEEVVSLAKAKYILLSYSNASLNNVSNIELMEMLSRYGKTRVFSQRYDVFHGAKHIADTDNKERLFLCNKV